MEELSESEEIFLLRHRFARTIEVWTAYNVFLKREVKVGGDFTCDEFMVEQTTHTLLVIYYSYLYSLFDPSGTDFEKATQPLINKLTTRALKARADILAHWNIVKEPLNRIRHNIGFHGGKKIKNSKSGYAAYRDANLHPWSPDYILNLLRVFFRDLDKIMIRSEPYYNTVAEEDTEKIYQMAQDMKKKMDEVPMEELLLQYIESILKTK